MNPSTTSNHPSADAHAVEAIRAGDRERYRELVERHADKVFAIAWCRLGDHDLAEEAAQETFISGFRRLALLGSAEKFGAWISAIARNTAINLGLRRRGELRKRERWALEQDPPSPTEDPESPCERETLRTSLESLPPIHRECLALFYLEGRSVAESAQTLGIHENAFKVRLHRARALLRETLEAHLESGLDRLRAPGRLTHAVMLALPASPGGALAFGGLASGFFKALPFGFVLFALQIASVLPGLFLARWLGHRELANFREPQGFRGHLYRRWLRGMLAAIGVLIVSMHLTTIGLGLRAHCSLFGAFFVLSGLDMVRRFHVVRNPPQRAAAVGILLLAVPLAGMGWWNWPLGILLLGQGVFFLIMSSAIPQVAPRMDYSLFTRAGNGILPGPEPDLEPSSPSTPSTAPDAHELLAFARFLGGRMLIEDWRRTRDGLVLRLPRVVANVIVSAIPFYWGSASRLVLHRDGRISARLGVVDRRELTRASSGPPNSAVDLDSLVSSAVQRSFIAFRGGDLEGAERLLGQQTQESIFIQPPASTTAVRWRVVIMRVAAVLVIIGGLASFSSKKLGSAPGTSAFKPISITESDVRSYLAQLAPGHPAHTAARRWWGHGLALGVCLPPAALFPTEALHPIKAELVESLAANTPANMPPEIQLGWALGNSAFLLAAASGFLTPEDLRPLRLDPDSVRASLPLVPRKLRDQLLGLQEIPVQDHPCIVLTTRELALRIRFLAQSKALDLVDLSPIVPTLVAAQVLSTNKPAQRCDPVPTETIHGLFHTRFDDLLRDTRDVLLLLEAAGALDKINRAACVAGILRLHRGKGLFAPPASPEFTGGWTVKGDATNTWFAFESLRILKALDQVPDLDEWRFRASPGDFESVNTPSGPDKVLSWPSLEAWCLKRTFQEQRSVGRSSAVSATAPARIQGNR